MRRFLDKIWKRQEKKPARLENDSQRELFVKEASEQIRQLSKKGLSIPVFTL